MSEYVIFNVDLSWGRVSCCREGCLSSKSKSCSGRSKTASILMHILLSFRLYSNHVSPFKITLKRAWDSLSWMERFYLVYMIGDINSISITHEDVERMKVGGRFKLLFHLANNLLRNIHVCHLFLYLRRKMKWKSF